jgi:hypothetical protein
METLHDVWIKFGYAVYWIAWFTSAFIYGKFNWQGIAIGVASLLCWFIVEVILWKLDFNDWPWEDL